MVNRNGTSWLFTHCDGDLLSLHEEYSTLNSLTSLSLLLQ